MCLKLAPVRLATNCHGTKFEWCSSSVITTTSPGPRLSSPQAYATRLIASVALRVKTTSRAAGAFRRRAHLLARALVALGRPLGEPVDAPVHVRVAVLVEVAHRVEHLAGLLGRGGRVEEGDRLAVDEILEVREIGADALNVELCLGGYRHVVMVLAALDVSRGGLPCRCHGRGSAISRSRSTATAAPARISASRCMRCRSEVSWSSFCFSSGANSKRPASSNESCSADEARLLDLGAGQLHEAMEELERVVGVLRIGRIRFVLHRLDEAGLERPALGQLREAEPLAAFDDDVQAAVVEAVEHLGDQRARADLAQGPRRRRRRARTPVPGRDTRRSAPDSAPRRCAAGSAPSAAGRSRVERGRARSSPEAY